MKIDKYTKYILTLIAIGIIGINYYLFKINFIDEANASPNNMRVIGGNVEGNWVYLITENGAHGCRFWKEKLHEGTWVPTGC